MITKSTFKHLIVSGLLVLGGVFAASAQQNAITAVPDGPVTTASGTYRLSFSENIAKSGARSGIVVGASSQNVNFSEIHSLSTGDMMVYDVQIPIHTPLGATVYITFNGLPLWHVTVADILGTSQNDGEVSMRPLEDNGEDGGAGSNPGSVSQPAPTGTGGSGSASSSGSGIEKSQPKIDLFPNPAVDQILIVTEGEVLWGIAEVIDLTGKKILEVPTGSTSPGMGPDKLSINVTSLKAGLYFVRVRVGAEVLTKRFQVINR